MVLCIKKLPPSLRPTHQTSVFQERRMTPDKNDNSLSSFLSGFHNSEHHLIIIYVGHRPNPGRPRDASHPSGPTLCNYANVWRIHIERQHPLWLLLSTIKGLCTKVLPGSCRPHPRCLPSPSTQQQSLPPSQLSNPSPTSLRSQSSNTSIPQLSSPLV